MQPPDPSIKARPHSRTDLFISFTLLALQGFGGVLAIVQYELVEKKRWLTREEFIEDWAVAQIMPGANVVNLVLMVGGRYFGLSGALAALCGMLAIPLLIALLLSLVFSYLGGNPQVANALRGMSAVAAGLIIASGIRLVGALRRNPLGLKTAAALCLACFCAIALLRWPMPHVLPGLGLVAYLVTYKNLKP